MCALYIESLSIYVYATAWGHLSNLQLTLKLAADGGII